MSATDEPRRLPGASRFFFGLGGYAELWLLPHELIYLNGTVFAETHMRFLLRDIQAVSVVPSKQGKYLSLMHVLIIVLVAIVTLVFDQWFPIVAAIIGAFIMALLTASLIYHLIPGPTCSTTIHTRAHKVKLRCLDRSRSTNRALQQLQAAVTAVQGPLAIATATPTNFPAETADVDAPVAPLTD